MTSVMVVLAACLLFSQLSDSGHAITISSDKKVAASEKERNTESLTFSANGEDQLIFTDKTFQVRNEGSQGVASPIRRASDVKDASEFFESGWRPMYSFNLEQTPGKISDQLPQEAAHQPTVVAEPWNRTTRFFRFSESDIMNSPVVAQVEKISEPSSNVIRFKDISSEEELSYEETSEQFNGDEINLALRSEITPRMLKFEENDRMMFEDDSPKVLKFPNGSARSQPEVSESAAPTNYAVYLIEKMLNNATGFFDSEDSVSKPIHEDVPNDTQPRIVKIESDVPATEETSPSVVRNASRFFRFEESDTVPEKTRFEQNQPSTFNFFENDTPRQEFKFTRNDETRTHETFYNSGEPFRFHDTDSRPQGSSSSHMRFEETPSKPLRFFKDAPTRSQLPEDQFYTVKATIQIEGANNPSITPPTVPIPVTTRRPKKKKGKIYNQHGIDIRKQDGFNYQQPSEYDNYLQQQQQQSPQYQAPLNQYQANYQIPPTPQTAPETAYYQNPSSGSPGTPYPPFDPNTYYIQNYLANYPYPQQVNAFNQQPVADASASYPSVYPQQANNVPTNLINGGQSDSPISPQSIFGFLQSIFNFAPGTVGNYPAAPSSHGGTAAAPGSGSASPIMAVSTQLRKALDNIAGNDELQCVPKLICMMSRRTSGQGFSTYVNRGLLSTLLSAVPDSSPWLKFSRAALLGYGIGANSCDVYYPKCPKDESEIIHYLNNHRGGFFRFFNDDHTNSNSG
ncbi:uncharacterized protein LOC135700291 [Ochlerotatus camptorhynchus]|uniref:uncharacterized protein LOC135700291 n=1 Tax=Ochlerotatus camptorhynchus TaxID=644619 RepID=UPI0031E2B6E1